MDTFSAVVTPDEVRTMTAEVPKARVTRHRPLPIPALPLPSAAPLEAERLELERARTSLQRLVLAGAVPPSVREACLEMCGRLGECATILRREANRLVSGE